MNRCPSSPRLSFLKAWLLPCVFCLGHSSNLGKFPIFSRQSNLVRLALTLPDGISRLTGALTRRSVSVGIFWLRRRRVPQAFYCRLNLPWQQLCRCSGDLLRQAANEVPKNLPLPA